MRLLAFITLAAFAVAGHAVVAKGPEPVDVTIYAYDSLLGPKSLSEVIRQEMEKSAPQCRLNWVSAGNGGQILTRLTLEEKQRARTVNGTKVEASEKSGEKLAKSSAHLVVGIDGYQWEQARRFVDPEMSNQWLKRESIALRPELESAGLEQTIKEGFVPFDFGIFSMIVATERLSKGTPSPSTLSSLKDLVQPGWKKKFILQDPRTSTPGFGFLLFTLEAFPNLAEWTQYISLLSKQWLSLPPGWDQSYDLFLKGEAPAVWSYTTSEAYHLHKKEPKGKYKAVLFAEGNPGQIEGAFFVKPAEKISDSNIASQLDECKIAVMASLQSRGVQDKVGATNWMFPVRKDAVVPEEFKDLPTPKKLVLIPRQQVDVASDKKVDFSRKWIDAWQKQVQAH